MHRRNKEGFVIEKINGRISYSTLNPSGAERNPFFSHSTVIQFVSGYTGGQNEEYISPLPYGSCGYAGKSWPWEVIAGALSLP